MCVLNEKKCKSSTVYIYARILYTYKYQKKNQNVIDDY